MDLERLLELHGVCAAVTGPPARSAFKLGGCVHVLAAAEVVARDVADRHAEQEVAGAMVSADVPERLEELALEEHGVAGRAVVGGADRRGLAVARADHPSDRVRRHARLVAERDHDGLAVRELGQSARERDGHALVPALAGARLRAVEVHGGGDLFHKRTEHHNDASDRRGRHRPQGVLQQRPAV